MHLYEPDGISLRCLITFFFGVKFAVRLLKGVNCESLFRDWLSFPLDTNISDFNIHIGTCPTTSSMDQFQKALEG